MFALSGSGVLEEYYTKAGFRDVEIRSVAVERHFSSLTEAIKALQGSFPRLQALLKKLNESDHEIAWKEIEQQLSRFDGSHGFTAPGEWLVAVGTK